MFFHLFGRGHHQVGHFVHNHHNVGQRFFAALDQVFVVANDVARASLVTERVAPLHLLDGPVQHARRLVYFGDNRAQKVGHAVVDAQLHHLRVHHQQAQAVGCVRKEQAGDNRIDADRLARTGGARDQQVGHARQIGHNRLGSQILAQRHGQRAAHGLKALGLEQFAQPHGVAVRVGNLNAHVIRAGDRRFHAHAPGRKHQRKIPRQRRNLGDLDLLAHFFALDHAHLVIGPQEIAGDAGGGVHVLDRSRDAMVK